MSEFWHGTGLMIGAVAGIPGGLLLGAVAATGSGAMVGAVVAVVVGGGVGLLAGIRGLPKPARGIRWRPPSPGVLMVGFGVEAAFGLLGLAAGGQAGAAAGVTVGFGLGVVAAVGAWLVVQKRVPLDISSKDESLGAVVSPRKVLERDRRAAIGAGVVAGLGLWAAFALFGLIIVGLIIGVRIGAGVAAGAFFGIVIGFPFGIGFGAAVALTAVWPAYGIARIWLGLRRRLPWQLMDFLEDAHDKRGVLRQVGAVYQFRNTDLQHWLATRPAARAGGPELTDSGPLRCTNLRRCCDGAGRPRRKKTRIGVSVRNEPPPGRLASAAPRCTRSGPAAVTAAPTPCFADLPRPRG